MVLDGANSVSLIDIGVNLTNSRFDKDRDDIISAAQSAGVVSQIITGTNAKESQHAFQLTQQYPTLYSTAGCHPHDSQHLTADDFKLIQNLLTHKHVVAIGECGLDFNRNYSPPDMQIQVFRQHLELACEIQKPLFLHERDASESMLSILDEYLPQLPNAVVHCFTGSQVVLESYLERNLHIGITGWICDERRGQDLANIVHLIPDDKLMIETDAPYLIPRSIRPKPKSSRNIPEYLPHLVKKLAECRSQSFEHIANISFENTKRFFKLPL